MKTCFKCGEAKPLSDFYRHPRMADGHLNKCKACAKRDVLEHRRDNVERIREYDRERSKQPHRIRLGTENMSEYRQRHPDRYRANLAVSNALRAGKLQKAPCACCGSATVEAHHADYSRPLDVVWLCPVHHRELHLAYPDDHYHNVNAPGPLPEWHHARSEA